jgi:hypothetical protein
VLRCVDGAGIDGVEGLGVSVFVGFVCVQASQRKLNQTPTLPSRESQRCPLFASPNFQVRVGVNAISVSF